ncbi:MAG: acyltransferase family protein [Eubacteriales bacterium]|nr:acyltransferase family protein [Eubacteriales bacterium]
MQKRIALWDNLKLFIIALVVIGHLAMQYFYTSEIFGTFIMITYTFTMPAFVFISGLFSKHSINSDKPPVKKAMCFIVLSFFIKVLNYIANIIFGVHVSFEIFYVKDIPWYMLAMGLWYLITWALRKTDEKYILICSVVLGCFAGYMQGNTDFLCILRFITFYPFFYSGYILQRESVENFTAKKSIKIFSAIFLVIYVITFIVHFEDLSVFRPLITARGKYEELGEFYDWGCLIRLAYYVLNMLIITALIALCPRKEFMISKYGSRTLQIYIYHRPIIYIMKNAGLFYLIQQAVGDGWEWIGILLMLVLTALLCPKFWSKPIDYLLNPKEKKEYAAAK